VPLTYELKKNATTSKTDYYELLGVPRKASAKDIRNALESSRANTIRPESRRQSSGRKIQTLQEAYDVLSDSKKRQMYDQYGFYSENMPPGGYGAGPEGAGNDVNFNFDGFDFGGGSGGGVGGGSFRDLFSSLFGGRGGNAVQEEAEAGADLEYRIEIDFGTQCVAR